MTTGFLMRSSLIALLLGAGSAQAETTFVFGDTATPAEPRPAKGTLPWLSALSEASGGQIKTEFLGGGAVVTSKNSMAAMRDGLIDGAFVSSVYFPAETPTMSLFINIGASMRDPLASTAALSELLLLDCPECVTELKAWNIHTLGAWVMPSYALLCKPEVRGLADVKGKRVRASGHTVSLANAIGAVPTNMTYTEVYEAMQRNQVDCTFGSIVWLESLSLGDLAKHVVKVDAGAISTPSAYNIREDLWQSLSTDERRAFIDTVPIAVAGAAFSYVDEQNRVLGETDRGYQVIDPDAEMKAALETQATTDMAAAVEKAKAAGVTNAQDILDRYLKLYAKWQGLTAGMTSADQLEPVLKSEIYDHVKLD